MNKVSQIALLGLLAAALSGCSNFENVPPSDIAKVLTPTGYDGHIYTPGQVDIGEVNFNGSSNQLVLIQRSGVEVKESFANNDDPQAAAADRGDHRCLTKDKAPATLDVRMLLALPNYETPEGLKDMNRLFMLGNPVQEEGSDRVLRISATSIYSEQARQVVRGKIRQICASYDNFDTLFAASVDESDAGLHKKIERAVAGALREREVPLGLVMAYPSNLKPDPSVVDATSAEQAAGKQVASIEKLVAYLDADSTGSRRMVYQMQVWKEIVSKAGANGHNTILFSQGGSVPPMIPLQNSSGTH